MVRSPRQNCSFLVACIVSLRADGPRVSCPRLDDSRQSPLQYNYKGRVNHLMGLGFLFLQENDLLTRLIYTQSRQLSWLLTLCIKDINICRLEVLKYQQVIGLVIKHIKKSRHFMQINVNIMGVFNRKTCEPNPARSLN